MVRRFDVASIKPHEGPMRRVGVTTMGSTLTADASNFLGLVMFAYNVRNDQVTGVPELLKDDNTRWDIVAKVEGDVPPTRAEFRQMLQLLLADRFKFTAHREQREMLVYALTVAKNGPKFKESAADANPMQQYGREGRNNVITMPKANMEDVVDAVRNAFLDRPVVDKTGLTGTYDIKITYTPRITGAAGTEADLGDISVFAALQEQLGLKLEPQKAMLEFVIVDHVEKPSGN